MAKESNQQTAAEIIALENQVILQTYKRAPFVFERGEGVTLYDTDGKAYLDFAAGIAVNALGYADPEVQAAIEDQAKKLIHVSNLYHTRPQVELAQMLVEKSFADRVFLCNSGTEAIEAAIKFSRKWARKNHPENEQKYEIVSFTGAFHGRTMGALAVTPREGYQAPFRPLMPGVATGKFNDLDSAAQVIGPHTAGVIVEPIQGEGGINPATKEFLQGLRRLCDQHQAALIFDEIQCGLGRTGTLWAHEGSGVEPDLMTLAKPLANGLPIGAVLMTNAIAEVMKPGDHGSTFAANPLVTRVATVVFRRISDPSFLAHVREVGSYLGESLHRLGKLHPDLIHEIRGRGLIWGIDLGVPAADIIQQGYAQGLVTINAGEKVLRLVPPLVISRQDVDTLIEKLGQIIAQMEVVK
ncbi:MAG: aspartate aminotransferase family protein [Chloroflexi bacterium]|nr:aspartate aminotransferase family protein [Chloroflexota bacterium]